jgi:hypothetical protein
MFAECKFPPYRFPSGDSEILAEAVRETHGKGPEEANNESDSEREAEAPLGVTFSLQVWL